jgi:hypothetical protein
MHELLAKRGLLTRNPDQRVSITGCLRDIHGKLHFLADDGGIKPGRYREIIQTKCIESV